MHVEQARQRARLVDAAGTHGASIDFVEADDVRLGASDHVRDSLEVDDVVHPSPVADVVDHGRQFMAGVRLGQVWRAVDWGAPCPHLRALRGGEWDRRLDTGA